jgi:hypothetical protein
MPYVSNLPVYYIGHLLPKDGPAVLVAQRVADLSLLILSSPYPCLCDEDLENVRDAFKRLRESKIAGKVQLNTKSGIAYLHKDI